MNPASEVILYGAGGHAGPVIDALEMSGFKPVFIVDDDPSKKGKRIQQVPVIGSLSDAPCEELGRFPVIIAIARNEIRKQVAQKLTDAGIRISGVRHPTSIVSVHADVHVTAQIMAGVIVNAGTKVGAHAVLNTGSIIEHDAVIGEYVHVGPGAVLAGSVILEEGVMVATGAKVCPSVRLCCWSTLGAGAVALHDVPPQSIAVGIPARWLRKKGNI